MKKEEEGSLLADRIKAYRAARAECKARVVGDPLINIDGDMVRLDEEEDAICALIGREGPICVGGSWYRVFHLADGIDLLEVKEGRVWRGA